MAITDRFVLPGDVTLVPVASLDAAVRAKLNAANGDFALARPGARTNAKLVNATTATILERFRTPTTIVDALIDAAPELDIAPDALLEAAHTALSRFVREGILVTPEAAAAAGSTASLGVGDTFAGFTVRTSLYVRSDTELYIVTASDGADAVLKVQRPGPERTVGDFEREARALGLLEGSVTPQLLGSGREDGRAWICMTWHAGLSPYAAAAELRRNTATSARGALAACALAVADAYAAMHERGVIHGDVHDGNVIMTNDGRARLVDFGLVRFGENDNEAPRGGVAPFYEPEFASAVADGHRSPAATMRGEQYAVAALLFGMFTGAHYLDLDTLHQKAMRQIVRRRPRRFADCGVPAWPTVERVLRRALEKDPARRFDSMAAFASALRAAAATASEERAPARDAASRRRRDFVRHVLRSLEADARLAHDPCVEPPTATVSFGAAGVAFALHRIAMLDGDPTRHALADQWAARAESERHRKRAYEDGDTLVRGAFGAASMNYGSSGIDVVAALVASARGDLWHMSRAMNKLARLPRDAGDALDLVLGVPSAWLGLALVADAVPPELPVPHPFLSAAARCAATVRQALSRRTMLKGPRVHRNLGIAHGWGGAAYVALRWQQRTGVAAPPIVRRRLDELAALAEPHRRGVRWPWRNVDGPAQDADAYMSGWCNGSAGFVHLWLMAYETLGDERYRQLAEAVAMDTWDDQASQVYDLCCGHAGRAYAMLAMHRATGNDDWLARARYLADRAMDRVVALEATSLSLYKGVLGPVLLYREMERPAAARMPLFEREA